MEVTQEMIRTLLGQNDAELQKKFAEIAAILGMNERAAANTAKFRNMLENTSPEELNRLLSAIGTERASEIIHTIGGDAT
ncbi:MAG: hypothetical protein IJV98_06260 [Clostridia bacterium]|nr:hypothetical protein [Clostridia bacterium]